MAFAFTLHELTEQVVAVLETHDTKLVLAESCTAGLLAASLGAIPGVSRYLCGSAVVYREQTKIDWLGVDGETLERATAVSPEATDEITHGVLRHTVEADWALGITGHLGPSSPAGLDGRVYVASYRRERGTIMAVQAMGYELETTLRTDRQREATELALRFLLECFHRHFQR